MNKEAAQILLLVLILIAIFGSGMYWLLRQTPPIEENLESSVKVEDSTLTTNKETLPQDQQKETKTNMSNLVTIKTSMGEIEIETYDNDAPKTAKNFKDLAQKGYYDGLIFHRVIKGFMIQGGDPLCGATQDKGVCGTGGPGYQFEDELNPATASYKTGYKKGVVAMANSGPNTNGSQFFIMHADYPLPNNYTIFGKVVKGLDVIDAIANTKTDAGDRPTTPVIMEKVTVSEL